MRVISLCSLVGVVLMWVPAGAVAQAPSSDPEADSPSGVVYELPVDRARKDAAPRRESSPEDGGQDGSAAPAEDTTGSGGSSIRSENNFGTSSQVPGAERERRSRGGGRDGARERRGEGSNAELLETAAGIAPSSTAGGGDGPSETVVFLLLGTLLAVGAAIGVLAGRRAARDRRG